MRSASSTSSPHGRRQCAALLVTVACTLSGCATGPRSQKAYFAEREADEHPVPIALGVKPKIAMAGFLQRDRYEGGKHERELTSNSAELNASVLDPVARGLSQNSALNSSVLATSPFLPSCPAQSPMTPSSTVDSCTLPIALDPPAATESLRSAGYSHLLLVLQAVTKDTGARDTTWGVGPGVPMFTTETTVQYTFTLTARLYELATGALVSEAVAADADTGYYGVMMIIYPFYSAPDEGRYIETMGQAVGIEIGRRFRYQSATNAK